MDSKNNMNFGRMAPQAQDLETAILGAILLEKKAFDLVAEILKPESFYNPANQIVFSAMISLSKANKPIDFLMMFEQIKSSGELDAIGGAYYLSKLTNSVVSSANIEAHANEVSKKHSLRELILMGSNLVSSSFDETISLKELIDETDKKFTEISTGSFKSNYTNLSESIVTSINRIEDLRAKGHHITGIESGFREIDDLTHGWQDTDLIILAARPSVGKTALALNFARNAAKEKPVAFFSMEMSTGQLINRMLSAESGIYLDKITNGNLNDYEMGQLYEKGVEKLSGVQIFIDDTAGLTIMELRSRARKLKRKKGIGFILIDYLQLMSGDTKSGNREQEISRISRDLKSLAKELKVPIMALSQLSRETEKRKGEEKTPQLSDLRESGAIEQDADMVIFLYRPEYYGISSNEMGESNAGETHVKFAKHRNGSLRTIKLQANLSIQKFSDSDSNITKPAIHVDFKSISSLVKIDHFQDEGDPPF